MKIQMGEERVIVRGIRPKDGLWGPYQFPRVYESDGRIVISVHVGADDLKDYGSGCRWFESTDGGESWNEIDDDTAQRCGFLLDNGERIKFLPTSSIKLQGYEFTPPGMYTPDYDFDKRAPEGVLPIPDGVEVWHGDFVIYAYNCNRLPESIAKCEWECIRVSPDGKTVTKENVPLDWPYCTHVIYTNSKNENPCLKTLFPRGNLKYGPDGGIWVTAFSGEGHINPKNGQYSPYYSAELFRSDDNAHSFKLWAHMEYPADGEYYPYKSGGFSDSDIEFLPDGSMIWFMRSTWAATTFKEWDPMYVSRSYDMGKTWTKPVRFADRGVLPRMCRFSDGTVLLSYARPGMFLRASKDGKEWTEPVTVMTAKDRSKLFDKNIEHPNFWQWCGACNNPEIISIGENNALLIYGDSYYPDVDGEAKKTVLCRTITVV